MSARLSYPLDYASGAGHVDNIFWHLWNRDPRTGQPCEGVFVTDTIVFRRSRAVDWFATDDDGQLIRYTEEEMTPENMVAAFMTTGNKRQIHQSGIVGYMMTTEENKDGEPFTHVEYFDRNTLDTVFTSRRLPYCGTLQRFVEPKGVTNSTLRVTWSPRQFLVERRDSVHKLSETRIAMDKRGATHEGAVHNSVPVAFANRTIIKQLNWICNNIAEHVRHSSPQKYRITKLVLNFKRDYRDQLWFIYASSIEVDSRIGQIGLPTDIWNVALSMRQTTVNAMKNSSDQLMQSGVGLNTGKNTKKTEYTECPHCRRGKVKDRLYSVTYSDVINHANAVASRESPYGAAYIKVPVPALLMELEPGLDPSTFKLLRRDPNFLRKTIFVCETCCLSITASTLTKLGGVTRPFKAPHQRKNLPPEPPARKAEVASNDDIIKMWISMPLPFDDVPSDTSKKLGTALQRTVSQAQMADDDDRASHALRRMPSQSKGLLRRAPSQGDGLHRTASMQSMDDDEPPSALPDPSVYNSRHIFELFVDTRLDKTVDEVEPEPTAMMTTTTVIAPAPLAHGRSFTGALNSSPPYLSPATLRRSDAGSPNTSGAGKPLLQRALSNGRVLPPLSSSASVSPASSASPNVSTTPSGSPAASTTTSATTTPVVRKRRVSLANLEIRDGVLPAALTNGSPMSTPKQQHAPLAPLAPLASVPVSGAGAAAVGSSPVDVTA